MWLWEALTEDKYGRTYQQHWILFSSRNLDIVDLTIVIAYEMQIGEAFEYHNKTVTRQTSSQRKSRRLSGKLHCLNFVFPAKNETLGPVFLGYEASSSSVSLSMLKVPTMNLM